MTDVDQRTHKLVGRQQGRCKGCRYEFLCDPVLLDIGGEAAR